MELGSTQFLLLFIAVAGIGMLLLFRLIQCPNNKLDWADLVSTNGILNAYKLGYWVGVAVGSWVVIKSTYADHLDGAVFAAYLAFLGGVPVAAGALGKRREAVDDPDK